MYLLDRPVDTVDAVGSTARLPPARLMAALPRPLASARLLVTGEPEAAALYSSVPPGLTVNELLLPKTLAAVPEAALLSWSVPPLIVAVTGVRDVTCVWTLSTPLLTKGPVPALRMALPNAVCKVSALG